MRLAGVLDHTEAVRLGNLIDAVHIRRVAIEVDRDHGLRTLRYRVRQRTGVHGAGLFVDVHEDSLGAAEGDRLRRSDERGRRGDHFVTGADVTGPQGEMERVRPRTDGNGVACLAEVTELLLKAVGILA